MTLAQFPKLSAIEYPVGRKIMASSLVQKAISGRVTDQPKWNWPLYEITLSFSGLNSDVNAKGGLLASERQQLEDFWTVQKFGQNRFAFDDPNDDQVSGYFFATGDGVTENFQLTRTLRTFAVPVLVPQCGPSVPAAVEDDGNFSGAATLFEDDGAFGAATSWADDGYFSTLQIFAGAYATEPTTPLAPWSFANGSAQASGGVVEIVPAPANGLSLSWTGNYLLYCRFPDDALDLSNVMYQVFALKKLTIETARL